MRHSWEVAGSCKHRVHVRIDRPIKRHACGAQQAELPCLPIFTSLTSGFAEIQESSIVAQCAFPWSRLEWKCLVLVRACTCAPFAKAIAKGKWLLSSCCDSINAALTQQYEGP